jgi:uncharacterized protein YbjT (DUF2867 family)
MDAAQDRVQMPMRMRMRMRMRVLVFGANGVRGGAMARRLLARGHAVRVIARDPAASPWVGAAGVEVAAGDLGDRSSLERAGDGMDAVVLQLPLVYDRELAARYVDNAVAAATSAGARRLVYQGNIRPPAAATDVAGFEIDRAAAAIVLGGGVPATVLRPTIYMDNLLGPWTAPGIVNDGMLAYPIPAAAPTSWLSADDAAALAVAALERPEPLRASLDLGGPEALTGDQAAERLGRALGRPVRYLGLPIDAFEQGLRAALGPETGAAIAATYRWDAEHGDGRRNVVDPAPLVDLLGGPLTTLEEWAARQSWPSPATAAVAGSAAA